MDLAAAFSALASAIGSAGPWAVVTALLVGHLILDVYIIRAGLRRKDPLWVPGWIYQDKAEAAEKAVAQAGASAQANRDLTDALIRRSNDESRVGRSERRRESPGQWNPRGQSDSDSHDR